MSTHKTGMPQNSQVIAEVKERIKVLEQYLSGLSWWQFSKREECRAAIEGYRLHLKGLVAREVVDKIFQNPELLERATMNLLASPALSD